jgi:hypothetical protein
VSDPTEIPARRDGTPGTDLGARYGRDRPRQRTQRRVGVAVLAVLLVGGLLAWGIWAAVLNGDKSLTADVSSYDVVDAHQIRVRVAAHVRDDATGSCLLRATAQDHTSVGELNLTAEQLRAAGRSWISIRTERRATTATVVRCSD